MTGVVSVMVFLHLSSQVFVMWPYYRVTRSFTPAQLARVLVPFNVLVAYMYVTYYQCFVSDAGGVPPQWSPDAAMAAHGVALTSEHRRFCHKCDAFKPPRAHHCKQCKRCVLRMDHHCPWIGNCVGIGNQAHFQRFLVGLSAAGTWLLVMIFLRVVDWWNTDYYLSRPSTLETVMIVLDYIIGVPPIVLTSFLMWYQWYLLATNTTSIETHEQDRVTRQIRRGQLPYFAFPFDVGIWTNLTQVLGPNILFWVNPFAKPVHDGLLYPVVGPYPETQFLWPPPDPRAQHRRRAARPASAFTYGDEQLNPALTPPHTLRSEARCPSPVQDASAHAPASDEAEWLEHSTSRLHVRRGSEGLEIRPPMYSQWYYEIQQQQQQQQPGAHYPPPHALDDDDDDTLDSTDASAPHVPAPKIVNVLEDEVPLAHLVRRHPTTDAHNVE